MKPWPGSLVRVGAAAGLETASAGPWPQIIGDTDWQRPTLGVGDALATFLALYYVGHEALYEGLVGLPVI